jgi:hypothetical protein
LINAKNLQVIVVEASQIFQASDAKLASALTKSPHLYTTLTEFSLSALQEKINLSESSIRLLLDRCRNLTRIKNVAYWNVSTLDLRKIQKNYTNVNILNAIFLPNKIIPV